MTRLRHLWLVCRMLLVLAFNGRARALFTQIRTFIYNLPKELQRPLPQAMQHLTPTETTKLVGWSETAVRDLADTAALLARRSPLGLCLRRSLARYYFLGQLDVPLVVQFGAKFVPGEQGQENGRGRKVTGHAWLTRNGQPYYELNENWQGFVVMYTWPE